MNNTTNKLIAELEELDKNELDKNELDKNSDRSDNEEDKEIEEKKTICRMIRLHLKEFYNDIYIPYDFFRDDEWKINKVLYNNEDVLFYNKKYLAEEDMEYFYGVFDKFISLVEENFMPSSKLFIFLKKWTDTRYVRWRDISSSKSYLKCLLTNSDYQDFSPAYIAQMYCEYNKEYRDEKKVRAELEKHLNVLLEKSKNETKIFRKAYKQILELYVYEYPINNEIPSEDYVLGFLNSVTLAILDFIDKMLSLNIYAIHTIIIRIIEFYTDLDEINHYNPKKHGGRKLYII